MLAQQILTAINMIGSWSRWCYANRSAYCIICVERSINRPCTLLPGTALVSCGWCDSLDYNTWHVVDCCHYCTAVYHRRLTHWLGVAFSTPRSIMLSPPWLLLLLIKHKYCCIWYVSNEVLLWSSSPLLLLLWKIAFTHYIIRSNQLPVWTNNARPINDSMRPAAPNIKSTT